MKKGQVYTGRVEAMEFPNKGIVTVEVQQEEGVCVSQKCVVKNALPGQRVTFAVNKVRKGRAEGRLLQVETPSPEETGSPCPHFGACGGCTYLSFPYEKQLSIKEAQVKKLLDGVLKEKQESYVFEGIKSSPAIYEYRNKMEFSFGDEVKDGPLSLGMHKRGSFYDVVTTKHCCLVDEDYRKILTATLAFFAERSISYYHRLRKEGYLRHLLVRKASKTGEILAVLVTTSQGGTAAGGADLPAEWAMMLRSLNLTGRLTGILHITNDSVADAIKNEGKRVLYGQEHFYEELLGLRFQISPFSFFQTNSAGAEVLYQTAREYIVQAVEKEKAGKKAEKEKAEKENAEEGSTRELLFDGTIYDLYSGTGTIAQMMAPAAKKVIGVEIVEEAVLAARENAALNGLTNCHFIAGDVLKVLDTLEEKPDLIILDPPRDGVHPKALKKIIQYGVKHLLYISCKPTSLARDLEPLLEGGYRVERAVAVDQFPWTTGIETVVLLTRKIYDFIP